MDKSSSHSTPVTSQFLEETAAGNECRLWASHSPFLLATLSPTKTVNGFLAVKGLYLLPPLCMLSFLRE